MLAAIINRRERWLLGVGLLFLTGTALALEVAPAVRAVIPLQSVWNGQIVLAWILLVVTALAGHWYLARQLPHRDPLLYPIAILLSGWGIWLIWRLEPDFGWRQTIWLMVSVLACCITVGTPDLFSTIRRFPYLWLIGGTALTALTMLLGTNPSGQGQRLWLGCCGLYFQPAEFLKLFLIFFLSGYLSNKHDLLLTPRADGDSRSLRLPTAFFAPLAVMGAFSMGILVLQRDLGASTLLFGIFIGMLYVATGSRFMVLLGGGMLAGLGWLGYQLFQVVQVRIGAWWNPWQDAGGDSFQIVQSLIALAAGGVFGRGFGIGSPRVIPVVHSDFIYAAVVEEWGMLGGIAVLILLLILTMRFLRIATVGKSGTIQQKHQQFLVAGIGIWVGLQSCLIIGGVTRALPLTGVTVPFLAYGGSSLLVHFIALGIVMRASQQITRA